MGLHATSAPMIALRLLPLFLLLAAAPLAAQSDYQQLLPAANNGTTAAGTGYTWSLGDVFADDVTGSQAIIISRVEEDLARTYGLRLLGNPTAAMTRLELNEPIGISYQIFDLNGRLLKSHDAGRALSHQLDLGELPPNLYLLAVYTTEGRRLLATYRVRKQ